MSMGFQEKIFKTIKKIPKGKVITYLEVAKEINCPTAYRAVGNILNRNYDPKIPCHRIVRSDGRVGGFRQGTKAKIKKLQKEGIKIYKGKIDLEKYKTA